MASGDLLGSLTYTAISTASSQNATGSVSVAVGDLVCVHVGRFISVAVTGASDNLGNSYTAMSAGVDGGNPCLRSFYSRVTNAGTLTSVTVSSAADSNDIVIAVNCYAGPFKFLTLDANLETTTADLSTPYLASATGTLQQADELVVGAEVVHLNSGNVSRAANGSFVLGSVLDSGADNQAIHIATCRLVVASTASVQPGFTGTTAADNVFGTYSFRIGTTAIGELKGTLSRASASQTNPSTMSGSVSVAVGDLIYAVFGEYNTITVSGTPSDNLGNSYTWCNAGTDAGNATSRAAWSIATQAGTLTSISATATASAQQNANFAAIVCGEFAANANQPAANPADNTDATSPFTCPSTGTLPQADCVVMAFAAGYSITANYAATSPNLLAGYVNQTTIFLTAVGYQKVSSTSAIAPEFTASNPGSQVCGTTAFKLGTGASSGTAVLAAQSAIIVATGESLSTGSGALAAGVSTVSSAGTSASTGTGVLAAQAVAVSGAGTVEWIGTGALAAQAATASGVDFSIIRPAGDSVDGNWVNELGNNTNLFSSIDEAVPDDAATFIRSAGAPANDVCKIALQNPGPIQTPMRIRYRFAKSGTDTIDLTVRLLQGTTVVWSTTHNGISESYVTNDVDVTPSPAITDPSNLFVEFSADKRTDDAATTAWVAQVVSNGGSVSDARKTIVDTLIVGIKADGIWSKLDRLWLVAAENTHSALTDLVGLSLATAVNSPSFTADRGYTGNGSSSYVDLNFAPNTGPNFTLNSAHFGVRINSFTPPGAGIRCFAGCYSSAGANLLVISTNLASQHLAAANDGSSTTTAGGSSGTWIVSRTASNARELYKNGSTVVSDSQSSSGIVTTEIFACARNAGGGGADQFSVDQISAIFVGGGLNDTEAANLSTRLAAYMTAVGA